MTKRLSPITADVVPSDGQSQQGRVRPALDPGYVGVEERTPEDLLNFVQALAQQIRFYQAGTGDPVATGTWSKFASFGDQGLSAADVALFIREPERFTGEVARFLGRPHFALLLVFLELTRHVRKDLQALTGKHLDYYYRDVLRLAPRQASPDRVFVSLTLVAGVPELRLPVGTALSAGRSAQGTARQYLTQREVTLCTAQVAEVRAVHVAQRLLTVSSARKQPGLTEAQRLDAALVVALDHPPDAPLLPWQAPNGVEHGIGAAAEASGEGESFPHYGDWLRQVVLPLLRFAGDQLGLYTHELQALLKFLRRRDRGQAEWAQLKLDFTLAADVGQDLYREQDFLPALDGRLVAQGGKALDFEADALPLISSLSGLYHARYRDDDVRGFVEARILSVLGIDMATFERAMQIKLRMDGEWRAINQYLERAGRRKRKDETWQLSPAVPEDFEGNWEQAVPEVQWQGSVAGFLGITSLRGYGAALNSLERHLHLTTAQLWQLSLSAPEQVPDPAEPSDTDWPLIEGLLEAAHRELVMARRRRALNLLAKQDGDGALPADSAPDDPPTREQQRAAMPTLVAHVLTDPATGEAPAVGADWAAQRALLARVLSEIQLQVLDAYVAFLEVPHRPQIFGWDDVLQVLELAQRSHQQLPEPQALHVQFRNLYAYPDVRQLKVTDSGSRWPPFGRPPRSGEDPSLSQALGFMVCSPLLELSAGRRLIVFTCALDHDLAALSSILGLSLEALPTAGAAALAAALWVQVSTAEGLVAVEPADGAVTFHVDRHEALRVSAGAQDESAEGEGDTGEDDLAGLQIRVTLPMQFAPLRAPQDMGAPVLKVLLRQQQDPTTGEPTMAYPALGPLRVRSAHLAVEVGLNGDQVDQGLSDLQVQAEDRTLDPKGPLEPFGPRPAAFARLHIAHPELLRARLDRLVLDLTFTDLPVDAKSGEPITLTTHYGPYFDDPGGEDAAAVQALAHPTAQLSLVDGVRELALMQDVPLLQDDGASGVADPQTTLAVAPPEVLSEAALSGYQRLPGAAQPRDVREHRRYVTLTLNQDLGQALYPAVTARRARELSVALGTGDGAAIELAAARAEVPPPYVPALARLQVGYRTSAALQLEGENPLDPAGPGALLHVHPFGWSRPRPEPEAPGAARLLPRYDHAGELYIGLRDLAAPRHVTLFFHAAEGTADAEALGAAFEPDGLQWSYLDGGEFRDLRSQGGLLHDSTQNLIQTGIVELALPESAPGERLPQALYWLRATTRYLPRRACDLLEIRTNAVQAQVDLQQGPPDPQDYPLPAQTITDLVVRDRRIEAVDQPAPSFEGRGPESEAAFRTRVSERLRHKQRALSAWDYEHLALQRFADLYKVKCLPAALTGEPGAVTLVAVPNLREGGAGDLFAPRASATQLQALHSYLQDLSPPGVTIRVRSPRYVPVQVRLAVRFKAHVDPGFAKGQLNRDLIRLLSPWAHDGAGEITLGGQVYVTSVVGFADGLDYVDFVSDVRLFRILDDGSQPVTDSVQTTEPGQVLVSAVEHHIDVIHGYAHEQTSYAGIGYMKIELDFVIG